MVCELRAASHVAGRVRGASGRHTEGGRGSGRGPAPGLRILWGAASRWLQVLHQLRHPRDSSRRACAGTCGQPAGPAGAVTSPARAAELSGRQFIGLSSTVTGSKGNKGNKGSKGASNANPVWTHGGSLSARISHHPSGR